MEPYDDVYSRIDLLLPSELHFFKSAVNFRWRKQGQRQDLRCLDVHIEYHIVTVDAPEINMYRCEATRITWVIEYEPCTAE